MDNICLYGAGGMVESLIDIISEHYIVKYIIDNNPAKQGTCLNSIPIIGLDGYEFDKHPIVICVENAESAVSSLLDRGITPSMFITWRRYRGECAIHSYSHNMDRLIRDNILTSLRESTNKILRQPINDFSLAETVKKGPKYSNLSPRIFDIGSHVEAGLMQGGPDVISRALINANEEYSLINNYHVLRSNIAWIPPEAPDSLNSDLKDGLYCNSMEETLNNQLESIPDCTWLLIEKFRFLITQDIFLKMHKRFNFSQNDVFILQDDPDCYVFLRTFPQLKKILRVYHAQGSYANETDSFHKIQQHSKENYLRFINDRQALQIDRIKYWGFPSFGGIESFMETAEPNLCELMNTRKKTVLFNTYKRPDSIDPDKECVEALTNIPESHLVFVSVGSIIHTKGVDRIPEQLARIRRLTGIKFTWILRGNGGGRCVPELNEALMKYNIKDSLLWFDKPFINKDNTMALFERADFLIMMHRVSICDMTTLEAMSCGCIPILSKVGGNKELAGHDNGILISPETTDEELRESFLKYRAADFLQKQKGKNQQIMTEIYNHKAYIRRYHDVLNEVMTDG